MAEKYGIIDEEFIRAAKLVSKDSNTKSNENLSQISNINNLKVGKINKKRKYKLIKKIVKGIAVFAVTASLIVGGVNATQNIISTINNNNANTTTAYVIEKNEQSDLEFFDDLERYSEISSKIISYIEISEELHDLKLDKYDVNSLTYEVNFCEPNEVKNLIYRYEQLQGSVKSSIGNDAIELNNIVYQLQKLEKMYNRKLYNSYSTLESYSLLLAKSFVAEEYNIVDPSTVIFDYHYEKSEGMSHVKFDFNGETEYLDRYDDQMKYAIELVECADKMSIQKEINDIKIESYNNDRNRLLKETINKINKYASKTIQATQEENEKGNQK